MWVPVGITGHVVHGMGQGPSFDRPLVRNGKHHHQQGPSSPEQVLRCVMESVRCCVLNNSEQRRRFQVASKRQESFNQNKNVKDVEGWICPKLEPYLSGWLNLVNTKWPTKNPHWNSSRKGWLIFHAPYPGGRRHPGLGNLGTACAAEQSVRERECVSDSNKP